MKKSKVKRPTPKIVDLSIDFDYFIRVNPAWEFGFTESSAQAESFFYLQTMWSIRYQQYNLHAEQDLMRFADFRPQEILTRLQKKGVFPLDRMHAGFSESHKHAFPFFSGVMTPPDLFLNFDAHHDFYSEYDKEIHCGNWGTALYDRWEAAGRTRWVQVYPGWLKEFLPDLSDRDYPPNRPIEEVFFKDLVIEPRSTQEFVPATPYVIRNVFLCRSGVWVAPHHDPAFIATAGMLASLAKTKEEFSKFLLRNAPTAAENTILHAEYQVHLQQVVKELLEGTSDIVNPKGILAEAQESE